jgi:hydroxymethylbilane synthase
MIELASGLDDPDTSTAVRAERAFLARLGGGCSLPVGAYATLVEGNLHITGLIGSISAAEGTIIRGEYVGSPQRPEEAGVALAESLLARGGREVVEASEVGTL